MTLHIKQLPVVFPATSLLRLRYVRLPPSPQHMSQLLPIYSSFLKRIINFGGELTLRKQIHLTTSMFLQKPVDWKQQFWNKTAKRDPNRLLPPSFTKSWTEAPWLSKRNFPTVDGSEIPRPTTFWMYPKPLVNSGMSTKYQPQLVDAGILNHQQYWQLPPVFSPSPAPSVAPPWRLFVDGWPYILPPKPPKCRYFHTFSHVSQKRNFNKTEQTHPRIFG